MTPLPGLEDSPAAHAPTSSFDGARTLGRRAQVEEGISRQARWLKSFGFGSQDPHDFWISRLGRRAKSAYYRNHAIGSLAAAPFVMLDLLAPASRRLVAKPRRYPIADANFAMGYHMLHRTDGNPEWLSQAGDCLDSLLASRSRGVAGFGWGLPFDWESRTGLFPAGTPLLSMTPYGYEAFESAYELGHEGRHLEVMEAIVRFTYAAFPETPTGEGAAAAAYGPSDRRQVINASAYRAFLLIAGGNRFGSDVWSDAGRRNLEFVLSTQRSDGTWPYSVDGDDRFVDNIHTCFVLKNLIKISRLVPSARVRRAIELGLIAYRSQLLDAQGLPIPFAHKHLTTVRRELYDYAEAINLGLMASPILGAAADDMVDRIVDDLLTVWAQPDGRFASRRTLVGWNLIPYHRWGQSQVFRSLAFYRMVA